VRQNSEGTVIISQLSIFKQGNKIITYQHLNICNLSLIVLCAQPQNAASVFSAKCMVQCLSKFALRTKVSSYAILVIRSMVPPPSSS